MKRGDLAICDTGLIQAIKRGDFDAWAEVINHYQRPIYYFVMRIVRDHDQAAELTQAVFIQAHKRVGQIRDDAQFKPWLYKIALNLSRNHLRTNKRYIWVDVDEANLVDEASALDTIINEETSMQLRQAVDKLPKKQRLTVIFRVYQGLSYKEIAGILGSQAETVKVNYYHALNKLKGAMLKKEVSP